jgi:hypothetical protein
VQRTRIDLDKLLSATLEQNSGVLFADSAIVWRSTYRGSGLFGAAAEARPELAGRPGYRPVEWWIMSATHAENQSSVDGEGSTSLELVGGHRASVREVLDSSSLFGDAARSWPLIKILDIGGEPVQTDIGTRERPPIPPHVHSGYVRGGQLVGPGKHEAYFFLPSTLPSKTATGEDPPALTRIGLRADVTKEQLIGAVSQFGESDAAYWLLNEYEAHPYEGWTVPSGVVHAPGPITTVEMQTPQDDFNLLGWQLGSRLDEKDRAREWEESVLRGFSSARELVEEAVDFSTDATGDQQHAMWRPASADVVASGVQHHRAFVSPFQGEFYEFSAGAAYTVGPFDGPRSFALWTGQGHVNGHPVSESDWTRREFLLAPGFPAEVKASDSTGGLTLLEFGGMDLAG